jgi:hypothetical protein
MRNTVNTLVQVQCSVLVVGWQAIAPNGLFVAILLNVGTDIGVMSQPSPTEQALVSRQM